MFTIVAVVVVNAEAVNSVATVTVENVVAYEAAAAYAKPVVAVVEISGQVGRAH